MKLHGKMTLDCPRPDPTCSMPVSPGLLGSLRSSSASGFLILFFFLLPIPHHRSDAEAAVFCRQRVGGSHDGTRAKCSPGDAKIQDGLLDASGRFEVEMRAG